MSTPSSLLMASQAVPSAIHVPLWLGWTMVACLALLCIACVVGLFMLWRWCSALLLGLGMLEVFKDLTLHTLRQWQQQARRSKRRLAGYTPNHPQGWLSYVIPLPLVYQTIQLVLLCLARYSHIGSVGALLQQAETLKAFLGAMGVLKSLNTKSK
ncbi:MAG: hypothetical protein ACKO37_09740 [Vampirovibrionales bacterium]